MRLLSRLQYVVDQRSVDSTGIQLGGRCFHHAAQLVLGDRLIALEDDLPDTIRDTLLDIESNDSFVGSGSLRTSIAASFTVA
jgi:hypothetical protein